MLEGYVKMKRTMIIVLLNAVSLLTACSYRTEFVVMNESDRPMEVQYRVKSFPGSFAPPETPAIIPNSQLSTKGSQQWSKLSPDGYKLDPEHRTVSIRIMPGEALLVATMHNYGGHEDAWDAKEFPLEEITVKGIAGDMTYTNQQARTAFSEVSRALYTLSYK